MLARMISGELPRTTNKHGRTSIDRDVQSFRFVLNSIRGSGAFLSINRDWSSLKQKLTSTS